MPNRHNLPSAGPFTGAGMTAKAIINIAKGQLGLDEDTYRALLVRVTGHDSLRAMSDAQHKLVIDEMKRLGFKVSGRKVALAVTAGIRQEDFTQQGKWNVTLAQLLAPFDVTLAYIGADNRRFFAFYGAEDGPKEAGYAGRLARSAQAYERFLAAL